MTQLSFTTWLEVIAVFFGVCSVLLARKNNVLLYPTGIVSTGIYIWMLAQSHIMLYAESLLNAYYLIMSIYGWVHWTKANGKTTQGVQVAYATKTQLHLAIAITFLGWGVFYLLLVQFTKSNVPAWDAFVSSCACAGMWLLARRKIENWVWLNVSNALSIPLFIYKGLPLTSFLTLFLFVIAILGYRDWRKMIVAQSIHEHNN